MGQQQLLLVILVTILVGIATVVAINVFGTSAEQANRDAVRQDLLTGAAGAQAVWSRPAALGGAGRDFQSFEDTDGNLTDEDALLLALNMPVICTGTDLAGVAVTECQNENGTYSVSVSDANSIVLTGTPASSPDDDIVLTVTFTPTTRSWTTTFN